MKKNKCYLLLAIILVLSIPSLGFTAPRAISSTPANGDLNVNPNLSYIEVTFSEKMTGECTCSFSRHLGGRSHWSDDFRTFRYTRSEGTPLPAGDYQFTLNPTGRTAYFKSEATGEPLPETVIRFSVKSQPGNKYTYTYFVPFFNSSASYWTGLCVSNNCETAEAEVKITPYNSNGTPYNDCIKTVNVAKNGQDIGVIAYGKTASGWIKVESTKALAGSCFFGTALMADIPFVSTLNRRLVIAQVAQDNSYWDTQIMVCNPNSTQTSLTLTYYTKAGVATTSSIKTIPAWGSASYHLSDVFPGKTFNAGKVKLSVTSGGGIAAFALYYGTAHGYSYFAGINAEAIN